ncbi:hypothetical protein CBW65_14305 [Tumebacillus avium]|uniref:DUF2157 domain-containing protein n=1 Tax=Tumebacillus avium TaxID=1903704 RepID=A0A1Y0ING5_9BACL|nr:hypothetical protein [Tumebacillus avium]ARU62047.1 hypothetical protein CBW65_14305 [Tumebacillus avium]
MNPEQKKLIIGEIKKWRESRLIPTEYCDFLMNLYAEGDAFSHDQQAGSKAKSNWKASANGGVLGKVLLVITGLLLFLIFALNFTLFPEPMQIAVLLLGTAIPFLMAYRKRGKSSLAQTVWLFVAVVMVALVGYYYLSTDGLLADRGALSGTMAVVFLVWLLAGAVFRSRLVSGIGTLGLLLLYANFLEIVAQVGTSSYGVQHFYFMIPAFLALFFAAVLGRYRVYIAPVFLGGGLLALFGPDLRMLVFGLSMDLFMQILVFLKLAVLITLFIVYHPGIKKWVGQVSQ